MPSAVLVGDLGSVRSARALVARTAQAVDSRVRDVAVLLTSELVTNAVVHGGGQFRLSVDVNAERVRVSVSDDDPHPPDVLQPSTVRENGRGMAIVTSLATRWGATLDGRRKAVWFEMALPHHKSGGTVGGAARDALNVVSLAAELTLVPYPNSWSANRRYPAR